MKRTVRNAKGEAIVLNSREQAVADMLQNQLNTPQVASMLGVKQNAIGYDVDITTLTQIIKSVSDQKFFTIAPADYIPIKVGDGAYSQQLLKYVSSYTGGDFESGIINTGSNNASISETDVQIDSINIKVVNWAKAIGWSLFDLKLASNAGNWDLIESKEKSRKRNWDLGIQYIAFLGSKADTSVLGLLNLSNITINTAVITKTIASMTASEFDTLLAALIGAYRTNAANTAMPTHFIMPEADYNGLISFPDATYPLKTKLEILEDNLKRITMNPNFKVLPCAYADQANNVAVLNKNRYVLLNYDEDSIRMDLPVDYTSTLANTINGFQFNNVGYGQYTGVTAFRPKEVLYFDYA